MWSDIGKDKSSFQKHFDGSNFRFCNVRLEYRFITNSAFYILYLKSTPDYGSNHKSATAVTSEVNKLLNDHEQHASLKLLVVDCCLSLGENNETLWFVKLAPVTPLANTVLSRIRDYVGKQLKHVPGQ